MKSRQRRRSGFTLIELLLVLVILGVLAALVVPKFTGRAKQARETAAKADISQVSSALSAFEIDAGRYPTNEEGLTALIKKPANVTTWNQTLSRSTVPADPWGNAYIYRYPGQQNPTGFDLFSAGEDGREGTDDDIWVVN